MPRSWTTTLAEPFVFLIPWSAQIIAAGDSAAKARNLARNRRRTICTERVAQDRKIAAFDREETANN